jgi:hypothetical protein
MSQSFLGYLIELLATDEWKGVSANVDIAKGKHKLPTTWQEFLKRR